jgi:anti-sigma regulatory factor (Ser/Thr protein kinase)
MSTPAVRLELPALAENVAVVRQAVAGVASALGVEDPLLADLKMAVSEACANVVLHAYDEGRGAMEIEFQPDHALLTVVVRDRGRGVHPRLDLDGTSLGLGLPLMAALCDEVEVRHGNGSGTEVRLAFNLVRESPSQV